MVKQSSSLGCGTISRVTNSKAGNIAEACILAQGFHLFQCAPDHGACSIPCQEQIVAPYKWRQLSMLRLLRNSPQAWDLAQDCPLLLWLLADRVNEGDLTLNQACRLLQERRDQILAYILGYASRSLLRFLHRLRPSSYNHQEIRLIYQVLRSKQARSLLGHCKQIHLDLLAVVMEQPECARLPLVRSLLEQPDRSPFLLKSIKILINGCLRLAKEHDVPDLWTILSRCRSISQLERLNQELHNRYNRRYVQQKIQMEEEEAAKAALSERIVAEIRGQAVEQDRVRQSLLDKENYFPAPPFAGNEFIKPITSPAALRYEGSKNVMHNKVI